MSDKDDFKIIEKVDNKLKLVIEKTDAALIIDKDMGIKFVMQNVKDGEPVNMNSVLISAIATKLNIDPKFPQELMDFVENYGSINEDGISMKMNNYNIDSTTGAPTDIVWN